MNGTCDDRVLGNLDSRYGLSLTHIRRCGTVAGKEIKNSGNSGHRTRNSCGFFTPVRFYVGRAAAIQDPLGKFMTSPLFRSIFILTLCAL
ncbi:hypothetical protein [Xylella fastidiosa]|uniref:hypothetical protein n=1 Tax=Xylella fastidiosa TaxID=2371 RepID=UPI0034DF778E